MTEPCNCGKETFYVRSSVDKALKNHHRRLHRNFMYAYWCVYARGWHLSGSPYKKARGKR